VIFKPLCSLEIKQISIIVVHANLFQTGDDLSAARSTANILGKILIAAWWIPIYSRGVQSSIFNSVTRKGRKHKLRSIVKDYSYYHII